MELNKIYLNDCMDILQHIDDKSIDCIICDLPYGATAAEWDKVLPMEDYRMWSFGRYARPVTKQEWLMLGYRGGTEPDKAEKYWKDNMHLGLWSHYKRIIKDNGAIVLFGSEPFSTKLRASNPEMYKYDWIWKKNSVDGFFNAQCRPLKTVEMISVFSKAEARAKGNNMIYNPQGLTLVEKACKDTRQQGDSDGHKYFRKATDNKEYVQKYTGYPTEILEFPRDSKKVHPTQKPVALLEYLIKTYTFEGDIVLDNCMGSGSTIIAAINTNRQYIGIEKNEEYYKIAEERIKEVLEHKNN